MTNETLWIGAGSGLLISVLELTQLILFGQFNNCGDINVEKNESVLEEKLSFKMLGQSFSYKSDWGSYIVSIAKTASKKIEALTYSMKFPFPEVALYLYKSTIQPSKEYYRNLWARACSYYLDMFHKLQEWVCRTVDPTLSSSLESLGHHKNAASLSLFYRYYFVRSEVAELILLPYFVVKSTRYSNRLHIFLSPILDVVRMPMSTVSFLAQLDPEILYLQECFLLTYDLSGFKSGIETCYL